MRQDDRHRPMAGMNFRASSARLLIVAMATWLAGAGTALADNPLPFGRKSLPAEFQQLMRRPIGISFASMNLTETIDVSNLKIVLGAQTFPPGVVSLTRLKHTTHVNSVRGDVWLFPFLNVYGFVGKVSGTAKELNIAVVPIEHLPPIQLPSSFDYSGSTYGLGMTLAAGYRHVFASYDISYSRSSVDLLRGRIPSVTQGIRAGAITDVGRVRAAFYAGAFRESIRGTLAGTGVFSFGGLQPDFKLQPDFSMSATPDRAWDALAGASLEITPHFIVTAEGGFGGRKQFLISPGVRF